MSPLSLLGTLFSLSLIKAAPLVYAALGGTLCERAGVLNIALEGTLAVSAFSAVLATLLSGNALLGALAGIAAAVLFGLILGLATIRLNADHIVTGIGLNIVAQGATAAALVLIFGQPGTSPEVHGLGQRGEIFLIVLALLLAYVLDRVLACTPWGLHVRACGENPDAVRSAGLDARAIRLGATLVGSGIVGIGGVYLSLGELNLYSDGMTAGRGFIALAAIILGRWTPLGACGAALLFGAFSALQFILQRAEIPSEFMQAIPYLATLAAISGIGGRARPPAAEGGIIE